MPRADRLASRPVDITYRIFHYLRKAVRYDAEMMEVTVVASMIKKELCSFEEEQQIWLANLEKENNG